MILKNTLLVGILVSSSIGVYSQSATNNDVRKKIIDSIMEFRIDGAALLYPRIRQFSITHQENFGGTIQSKLEGKDFFKASFKSARTTINFNVPILTQPNNTVVASLGVVHQFFGMRGVITANSQYQIANRNTYVPMLNTGISYTHHDTLFGKSVSFSANVNGLFNPSFSSRQFTFAGLVTFPLKHTKTTNLISGAIINIDPSAPTPFILFISYFHKFKSLGIDLLADLPYRIALRKPIQQRASLSAFSELTGSNSFFEFKPHNPAFPQKMTYSVLEIKSGLLFEYKATKKMVLSVSGGMNATVKSRLLEQGAKPNDYFIKNTNTTVPCIQVGISMLPFWKGIFR